MRRLLLMGLVLAVAGCGAPSTSDWLIQLSDADIVKRRQAIRELVTKTAESERIVPALTEVLHDESEYVRRDAAWALGNFGAQAKDAVPALNVALKDKARGVRLAAVSALEKIDPVLPVR